MPLGVNDDCPHIFTETSKITDTFELNDSKVCIKRKTIKKNAKNIHV
jgi:hypothetical protein